MSEGFNFATLDQARDRAVQLILELGRGSSGRPHHL
jgi:hypothetical protein